MKTEPVPKESETKLDLSRCDVIAVCTSRVIFGNERAFRDAIIAIGKSFDRLTIVTRHEYWNEPVVSFFRETGYPVVKIPVVEYPLRGWMFKILREAPGRYLKSNIILFRIISKEKHNTLFLLSDLSIFLTFNIFFLVYKHKILYRCGSIPPTHNILQRIIFKFARRVIDHYVVDSEFMKNELVKKGVSSASISVIRPAVPKRFL